MILLVNGSLININPSQEGVQVDVPHGLRPEDEEGRVAKMAMTKLDTKEVIKKYNAFDWSGFHTNIQLLTGSSKIPTREA